MKILAIDSSGLVASVAIVTEDTLIGEYTINYKKTHSQTLLPLIEHLFKMLEIDKTTIDGIAISSGPGSFTGLRIGSATGKGLAMALNKPVLNIPTLKALAYNVIGVGGLICPMMDAKRSQVYTGVFRSTGNTLEVVMEQNAMDIYGLLAKLNNLGEPVIFVGDGIDVYRSVVEETLQIPYSFAPIHQNRQRAASVGALGIIDYQQERFETPLEHTPIYLRVSQAERERLEKEARTT